MADLAMRATELVKWFGEGDAKTVAVRGVSFDAWFGEMLYIEGPSGSGKTTLLSLISGILRPNSGTVLVEDRDLWKMTSDQIADFRLNKVGFVFQDYHLFPRLTTVENVAIPLILKRLDWNKSIDEAMGYLEIVGIKDRALLPPVKLSGGEQQRVAIARAIASRPDILIFDEPTSGLDPRGMAEVRAIIKQLKNKDRLVFMSSHLLPEVTEVCEEVAMIDRGKLIVFDTITNVKSKFARTVDLADVGFLSGVDEALLARIRSLEGVSMAQKTSSDHISIKFEGGKPAQQRLFAQLGAMNVGAVSFSESASGLEEAYLNLIQETL